LSYVGWILAIIGWIIEWLFSDETTPIEDVEYVPNVVDDSLNAIGDAVVDFYKDDSVSFYEKAAATAGAAYLIAPEWTADTISNAVEGVGDTLEVVAGEAADVVGSIFDRISPMGWVLIIGAAILLLGD
jgi:hypothetical protein